ncbi:hypothetical protein NPIL_388211 [Nephila pilipes]|uniref:Uncharacterized protein n=1 Tax=Nephila pilipes TaxID=299642 RepID=A0A8X6UC47_NEPPI|nr:hypothetical protein NPIL_388211 [Nephila pilipes]
MQKFKISNKSNPITSRLRHLSSKAKRQTWTSGSFTGWNGIACFENPFRMGRRGGGGRADIELKLKCRLGRTADVEADNSISRTTSYWPYSRFKNGDRGRRGSKGL